MGVGSTKVGDVRAQNTRDILFGEVIVAICSFQSHGSFLGAQALFDHHEAWLCEVQQQTPQTARDVSEFAFSTNPTTPAGYWQDKVQGSDRAPKLENLDSIPPACNRPLQTGQSLALLDRACSYSVFTPISGCLILTNVLEDIRCRMHHIWWRL